MLQKLHKYMKGWVIGILLCVLSLSFLLWGVQYYIKGSEGGAGAAATVDGQKITLNQVNKVYNQVSQSIQRQNNIVLSSAQKKQVRASVLQQLVTESLLTRHAEIEHFVVSQQQIDAKIASLPPFQDNGRFSSDKFNRFLTYSGWTPGEFAKEVSDTLVRQQVQIGLSGSAFILPAELSNLYRTWGETRVVQIVNIPAAPFLPQVKVLDEMVQDYYKANKRRFQLPTQLKIDYVLVSPEDLMKSVNVSDAQVQAYYQSHKSSLRQVTGWKVAVYDIPQSSTASGSADQQLRSLLQKLQSHRSESLISVPAGVAAQELVVKPSAGVLPKALSKARRYQILPPVTKNGRIRVVQLLQVQYGDILSLALAKPKVIRLLKQQVVNTRLESIGEEMGTLAYTHPDSLALVATRAGVPLKTSPLFSQHDKTGFFSTPVIQVTSFTPAVLAGKNSHVISLQDGSLMVLRLNKKINAHIQPLKMIEKKVRELVKKEQAGQQAQLLAAKLQSLITVPKKQKSLMAEKALSWKTYAVSRFRSVDGVSREVQQMILNMSLSNHQNVMTFSSASGDVSLIWLKKIVPGDWVKATDKEKRQFRSTAYSLQARLVYNLYLAHLKSQAKVVYITNKEEK